VDEDEYDMDNTRGDEKSGVQHTSLSVDDLALLLLPTTSKLVPAVSGMEH